MPSWMRASSTHLLVGSNSPFADADGNVQILPGNRIPAIPRNRIKAGFDYSITDAFKVGGDALFVSDQYFVGDESNQAPRLPSYAVFNAHASYQINKTFQIYGRVDNIFDNRYATYGTFFDTGAVPNFANGGAPFTRSAFGQPGAATCLLCRAKSNLLSQQWVNSLWTRIQAATRESTRGFVETICPQLEPVFRKRRGRERRAAPYGWRMGRTQNASGRCD